MAFTIRSAKQFSPKITARIQKSGRLGFGDKSKTLMKLSQGAYIAFATNDENVPVTHLIVRWKKDEDAFELKNGMTLAPFVETKQLFDFFHIDYVNNAIFYDLTREDSLDQELGGDVYRVNVRIKEKSNPSNDELNSDNDDSNYESDESNTNKEEENE